VVITTVALWEVLGLVGGDLGKPVSLIVAGDPGVSTDPEELGGAELL
jgi:hypothetical protein